MYNAVFVHFEQQKKRLHPVILDNSNNTTTSTGTSTVLYYLYCSRYEYSTVVATYSRSTVQRTVLQGSTRVLV
jgi:hypothetical protein